MGCGFLLNRGNAVSIPTPYGKHAFDRLLLAVGAAIETVHDTGIIFDFDKHQWGWLGTLAVNDGRKVGPFCLSIKEKVTKRCVISGITAAVFQNISGGNAANYTAPGDGGQLLGTSGKHYAGVECDCIGDDMLIITGSDRNIALFGALAFAFKREPAKSSVAHKADMPDRLAAKAELFGKAWICRFDRRIENEGGVIHWVEHAEYTCVPERLLIRNAIYHGGLPLCICEKPDNRSGRKAGIVFLFLYGCLDTLSILKLRIADCDTALRTQI